MYIFNENVGALKYILYDRDSRPMKSESGLVSTFL